MLLAQRFSMVSGLRHGSGSMASMVRVPLSRLGFFLTLRSRARVARAALKRRCRFRCIDPPELLTPRLRAFAAYVASTRLRNFGAGVLSHVIAPALVLHCYQRDAAPYRPCSARTGPPTAYVRLTFPNPQGRRRNVPVAGAQRELEWGTLTPYAQESRVGRPHCEFELLRSKSQRRSVPRSALRAYYRIVERARSAARRMSGTFPRAAKPRRRQRGQRSLAQLASIQLPLRLFVRSVADVFRCCFDV